MAKLDCERSVVSLYPLDNTTWRLIDLLDRIRALSFSSRSLRSTCLISGHTC
jgi:hypothetical protein